MLFVRCTTYSKKYGSQRKHLPLFQQKKYAIGALSPLDILIDVRIPWMLEVQKFSIIYLCLKIFLSFEILLGESI